MSLTEEGRTHQRILSLGQDPLIQSVVSKLDLMACLSADLYSMSGTPSAAHHQDTEAFSFTLRRQLHSNAGQLYHNVRKLIYRINFAFV